MRATRAARAAASRTSAVRAGSMAGRATGSRAAFAAGPDCASATGAIVGASTPSFAATRPERPRNSISESHGSRASGSGSRSSRVSRASASGTSRRRVTRSREMRIWSAWLDQGLAALGLLDLGRRGRAGCRGRRIRRSAAAAVLMPMPGAPGTLSTESPARAWTSTTRSGPTPNFSTTSSGPIALFFRVSNMTMPGATSCIRSLSAETMVTRPPARDRLHGVGGDDVVGLEAAMLDAGQVEGAGGVADQAELRDEVVGRRRAVLLVLGVEGVAEGDLGLVEDDGDVGGRVGPLRLLQHLPDHVGEAGDGADRQAVGLAGERRQGVVGAEDETRAVDQVQVAAGSEAHRPVSGPVVVPAVARFGIGRSPLRTIRRWF